MTPIIVTADVQRYFLYSAPAAFQSDIFVLISACQSISKLSKIQYKFFKTIKRYEAQWWTTKKQIGNAHKLVANIDNNYEVTERKT